MNEWVVDKMNAHKMSMSELARQSGMHHSNISKILSGKQKAGLEFYIEVARVFDAVPELLQVAGVVTKQEGLDMSLWELFKLVKSLSPEEQQEISELVDFLVQQKKRNAATSQTNPVTDSS